MPENINDPAPPTTGLVRRLTGRYLFVFAAVVSLVVFDQAVVQPLLARMGRYAPAINVAGRQRMLSQKLTKAALALDADNNTTHRRDELRETLAEWKSAHVALREGNRKNGIFKIQSDEIQHEWNALQPHFEAMCHGADQLIEISSEIDTQASDAAAATIIAHEAQFLASMDRIVSLMEHEAAKAIARLRFCAGAIAAVIVILLVGLGWFVIRPATQTIRRQLDELEYAVAGRTRELSAALASLQKEVQEREAADRHSRQLAAQLAHAARVSSLGHLTAGLAHELNHPLATIANYAEACDVELSRMESGARPPKLVAYFSQMKQAALRAGQIVRRMRNFVRSGAPSAVNVDTNELIRDVLELCRSEITQGDAELVLDLDDRRVMVEADPIQIQQVLVNLIQNGLQAMRERPCDATRLEVRSVVLGESVRIEVTDSGPGFATADLDSLFAPFQTTKRDGLGIGLAICRSIVEQHGGTIWAETPAYGGARVVFTLPLVESHAGTCRELAECVCR